MTDDNLDAAVASALDQFIDDTNLQGRALLIGGQAMRDWSQRMQFIFTGTSTILPQVRTTSDIDIHLAIEDEDKDAITQTLVTNWDRVDDNATTTSYRWKHAPDKFPAVTLDFISPFGALGEAGKVKTLITLTNSGRKIGAFKVLPKWITEIPLVEICHTPSFARLRINRLSQLGLLASKLYAIKNAFGSLDQASRGKVEPEEWTGRIGKDLADATALIQQSVKPYLLMPWNTEQRSRITSETRETFESLTNLKDRPGLLAEITWKGIQDLQLPLASIMETLEE